MKIPLNPKRHLYKIKKMYTENVIGQYTTNRWSESLIIFSDKYFEKEYKRIEQTKMNRLIRF